MTTSQKRFSIAADPFGAPVPPDTRYYFRERFRRRLHQLVLREFARLQAQGFTRKQLASRTGKTAAQISRYLGGPGNWTIATVSDLLIGMGVEPGLDGELIADKLVASHVPQHPAQAPSPTTPEAPIPPIEGQGRTNENVVDFMERLNKKRGASSGHSDQIPPLRDWGRSVALP